MRINFLSILIFFIVHVSFVRAQTAPTFDDVFSKRIGNLRLSTTKFDLGRISNNDIRFDTIHIFNSGSKPMNIEVTSKYFPFMKISVKESPLPADAQGYISLIYDAAKKNDYGFVMDRVQLTTDDSIMNEKFITVNATIQDYFPTLSDSDTLVVKTRAPEGFLSFGKVKQGNKLSHDFMIYNIGYKPLIIHKIKTTCPCLKATASKNEIAPGDSASVHAEFDSSGKEGKTSVVVYLFTNDPAKPEVKFEMLGEVTK